MGIGSESEPCSRLNRQVFGSDSEPAGERKSVFQPHDINFDVKESYFFQTPIKTGLLIPYLVKGYSVTLPFNTRCA